MSGFLGRMTARASGAAAEVAPRVPALFESAAVGTDADGVAVPEAESVPVRLPSVPPVSPSPSSRRELSLASSRKSAVVGPRSAVAAPASAEGRLPVLAAEPVAFDGQPASVRAERARVSEPTELRSRLTPALRQSQSSVAAVPTVPVVLAAAAPPGGMPESSAAAQRGPDVIRVSIGRVDVRAPAAPPRPAAPPVSVPAVKADRLSLQDYLRGQRGTG